MNEEVQKALAELRRIAALEVRAQERVTLAVSEYKARCIDNDPDKMIKAREEAGMFFEVLLDLTSDHQDQQRAALALITRYGGN